MKASCIINLETADFTDARASIYSGTYMSAVGLGEVSLCVEDRDAELALEFFEQVCAHFRTRLGRPED